MLVYPLNKGEKIMEERHKYHGLLIDAYNGTAEGRAEKWKANEDLMYGRYRNSEEKLVIPECSH